MLAARSKRQSDSIASAAEVCAAITSGSIAAVLPEVGGGYTGRQGLGLGVRQAVSAAAAAATPMVSAAAATASSLAAGSDPMADDAPTQPDHGDAHHPLPAPSAGPVVAPPSQIPVLLLRAIPSIVSAADLREAISQACSMTARVNQLVPGVTQGMAGGIVVKHCPGPSEQDLDRAVAAASIELNNMLRDSLGSAGTSSSAAGGDGGAEGGDGSGNKRVRANTDPSSSSSASVMPPVDLDAVAAQLGYDEQSMLNHYRACGAPRPSIIELSDPKRLPGAGYRRNVWVEYATLRDAAVAKHLLKRLGIELVGSSDPVTCMAELQRIKGLSRALGLSISSTAASDAIDAAMADASRWQEENPDQPLPPHLANPAMTAFTPSHYAGVAALEGVTLGKVNLCDALPDLPTHAIPRAVTLNTVEWHSPTYGFVPTTGTAGTGSGPTYHGKRRGGGRDDRKGDHGHHRDHDRGHSGRGGGAGPGNRYYYTPVPTEENEEAEQQALMRGYPYGRRWTCDIPSWASTSNQVAHDLSRALELAAVLDDEAGIASTVVAGADASAATASAAATTDGLQLQQQPAERLDDDQSARDRLYRDDYDEDGRRDKWRGAADDAEDSEQHRDAGDDGRRGSVDAAAAAATAPAAAAPAAAVSASSAPAVGPTVSPLVAKSRLYTTLYGANGVPLHAYTTLQQLDIAIAYLRNVHYYDYYSGQQGSEAGDIRQAVGDGYRRVAPPGVRLKKAGEVAAEAAAAAAAAAATAAEAPPPKAATTASTAGDDGEVVMDGAAPAAEAAAAAGVGDDALTPSLTHPSAAAASASTEAVPQQQQGTSTSQEATQPVDPGHTPTPGAVGPSAEEAGTGGAAEEGEEGAVGSAATPAAAAPPVPSSASSSSAAVVPITRHPRQPYQPPQLPILELLGDGTIPASHLKGMSDKARGAYDEWSRKHSDRIRGRLGQARRQIEANKRSSVDDGESELQACEVIQPAAVLAAAAAETGGVGVDAASAAVDASMGLDGDMSSAAPGAAGSSITSRQPKPATKDSLAPVAAAHYREGTKPVHWATVALHADGITRHKARLMSKISDNCLLALCFAACMDDSGNPDQDALPEPRRLEPGSVAELIRTIERADPASDARTRCVLCRKIFKAQHFAVKHLQNKHSEVVVAAINEMRAIIDAAIGLCLADAWYMRRAYFSDTRRPMPWHEPSTLSRIDNDTSAAVERLLMQGAPLAHYAAALGPSAAAAGLPPSVTSSSAASTGMLAGLLGVGGPGFGFGMPFPLMPMHAAGLGLAMMPGGQFAMGMGGRGGPGGAGGGGMGGHQQQYQWRGGSGRGGRGGGRGGAQMHAGGSGGASSGGLLGAAPGAILPPPIIAAAVGAGADAAMGGDGSGMFAMGRGAYSGSRGGRGGRGGTASGTGYTYRDRDAPKQKPIGRALEAGSAKVDYGDAMVSYEDI